MRIELQQFQGPLDLLLRLIEEQKLDITQIALATVTEQFLSHLRSITDLNPREFADWLIVAAKLLVIKSHALVPVLNLEEDEQEIASDLTWQLYQYKCYKEAAKYLQSLDSKNLQGWSGNTALISQISFYPDAAADTAALKQAMVFMAQTLEKITSLPKTILEEVISISDKIDQLQKIIAEKIETRLNDLIKESKSKTEIIVTFLALLELTKQKILTVEQEAIFSDIIIKKHSLD